MISPKPRILTVTDSFRFTPNLHRVSLGGPGLDDFPSHQTGGYIKLILPRSDELKPIVRTYTIRAQSEKRILVDFALHGSNESAGPATSWALNACVGDTIAIGGPGPAKPLPDGSGPFLLVGDMTALPAISVNLEGLPNDATGNAIILVRDIEDKQNLAKPPGVNVHWLFDADLGINPTVLVEAVMNTLSKNELSYVWIACEFEAMKLLRQYFRIELKFDQKRLYVSSYWKQGLVEDDHKKIKRADADKIY